MCMRTGVVSFTRVPGETRASAEATAQFVTGKAQFHRDIPVKLPCAGRAGR